MRRKKVLIIGGDHTYSKLMEDSFIRRGHEVIKVPNDKDLLENISEPVPDVFLLNVDTSDSNGCNAVHRLRSHDNTLHIPIAMIVAPEMIWDVAKECEFDVDEFLMRTTNMSEIVARVEALLDVQQPQQQGEENKAEDQTIKVLIGAKSESDARAVSQSLRKDQYVVKFTDNRKEIMRSCADHDVDVVLLDIELLKVEGRLICKEMKSNSATRNVPIVLISDEEQLEAGVRAGENWADEFLIKPVKGPELVARIKNLLRGKQHMLHSASHENDSKLPTINDAEVNAYSYTYFKQHIESEVKRARRFNQQFSLLTFSIEGPKELRDQWTLKNQKELESGFADFLQKELRDVDVIGRSKEGQFVVLLPHADSNGAFYVADRLRQNLIQHCFCATGNMSGSRINMNVGIAIFPLDATSSEGIVTAAHEALSSAKGLGQNQTFMYSSKIEPTHRILVVDDDARNLRLLETILTSCQYEVVKANTGAEALDKVYSAEPDLIILDVTMTKMDGFEVCRILKKDSSTRLIPVILNTVLNRVEEKVRAYEAGADDYLEKQVNKLELMARIRNLLKVRELHNALDSAENIIYFMADIVEAKDSYTEGHTDRVSRYASMLGKELGLSGTEIDHLKQGGVLHDIGKIGIPDAILKKPGRLTTAEFEVIRSHPALGYKICGNLKSLRNILPIIRHHHERLDGSGYPDRLKGDQIPLLARIVAICDVYDALTSNRPYRSAMSVEKALQILRDEARRGYWDADFVELFTKLILQLSTNS